MATQMPQVNTAIDPDDLAWLVAEGKRRGVTRSEMIRRAIRHYRASEAPTEPAKPQPTSKTDENQGDKMPRRNPSPPQPRLKRPHVTQAERKALPAKVTCERCGREQWPDETDAPAYHLRDARPGDSEYSELVPTMVPCLEDGATL